MKTRIERLEESLYVVNEMAKQYRKALEEKVLYLVILEDRHIDVTVGVFSTVDKALTAAKRTAAAYPNAEEEANDAWLYSCRLTTEDDYIRVERTILDNSKRWK